MAFVVLALFALLTALSAAQSGSGTTSLAEVAQGDSFAITGSAPGAREVAVWVFGSNRLRYGTATVHDDRTFTYELDRATTASFAPGEYVAVVQHPGPLGVLDVTPSADRTAILLKVPHPGSSVTIAGLQAPQAAYALMSALDSQAIDDTYTTMSFLVNAPFLAIDPVGQVPAGTGPGITGTTNLAPGDTLLVSVTSATFTPTTKGQEGLFYGASGSATVRSGPGRVNTWAFPVETGTFAPDEYIVLVSGVEVQVSDTASFTLVPAVATPVPANPPGTMVTTPPSATPPPVPASPPPTTPTPAPATPAPLPVPGFGALAALAGSAGAIILARRSRQD